MTEIKAHMATYRPDGFIHAPRWPLAVIVLLLAGMVAFPPWAGAHRERLRARIDQQLSPARTALLEAEREWVALAADMRGFLANGDVVFLTQLRDDLARARAATIRLGEASSDLGPELVIPLRELRIHGDAWMDFAAGFTNGSAQPSDRTGLIGQQRLENALSAAAAVDTALNRMEEATRREISESERLENWIEGGLGLAAIVVSLFVAWLLRRIQETSRQLGESEARFRQIAEGLREAIWIADPDYTRYYYINPAQEEIWGRSMASALQDARSFLDAVHPEDRSRVEASLGRYAHGEYQMEYRVLRPDGEVRWISATGYPVRDPDGHIFRIAGIAEDITEEKREAAEKERLLESERDSRQKLEAALRVRDQVLRIVSHDLKNPLHTIGMAAALLETPEIPEDQRAQQVGIISRAVTRASRMTSDLLDALRIEAGQALAIQLAPVEVKPLLDEISEAFVGRAEANHQRLTCRVDDEIGSVRADRDRVLEVLANLIGNAIKFTPEGGRIEVYAEKSSPTAVLFAVSDTGPGIPPDLLPTLFEPFAQAKDTATLGTGLGLAIASQIVQVHGGELSVETRLGEGTTFRFALPAADPV